jgi:sialic acid synthase SpsE
MQKERLERVKRFQLDFAQFRRLARQAQKHKVVFFSTPLDTQSLRLVKTLSPIIKVSSGDINNYPFLQEVAATQKTVILSTGLSTMDEITKAVQALEKGNPRIRKDEKLVLLHCLSAYPAPEEQVNLLSIPYLKEKFKVKTGYSDHTAGILSCLAAAALGACVVEKHFTYRKENQTFGDHALSADPGEFREMASAIRRIEKMRGAFTKMVNPAERAFKSHIRRSVAAARDLPKGARLRKQDICFLRPEKGIALEDSTSVLGKRMTRNIRKGELILKDELY